MPFRFVHAADIHLDSPLRSLALRDPALGELIGNATRRAFTNVVALCLEEQVDALLLSGDLYDGEQTSMKTARFLADQIGLLHAAGIAVHIIRGNHDALSRITKELTFPDSVNLFTGRAGAVEVRRGRGELPVVIHGVSFAQPHAPDSLLDKFKAPVEGAFNIGLLHTSLGGAEGHDPYAPCSVPELQASGFRYWALGHVHRRSVVPGGVAVVMPGMPQGRDIGESGPKSVTLATIGDDGSVQIEERLTSVAQFERVVVDVTDAQEWREAVGAIERALDGARTQVESEHLVARLEIVGTSPLAWRIRREPDLLRTEAESRAAAVGDTWIDKVDVQCRPPGTPVGTVAGPDPVEELHRIMMDLARDGAFRAEIEGLAEDLRGQLPPECRGALGADAETFASILGRATADGMQDAVARLRASSDGEAPG